MADIRKIAEAIIGLTSAEVNNLAQVLAKEYGITANEAAKVVATAKKVRQRQISKNWYIPKSIGKPCKPLLPRRK